MTLSTSRQQFLTYEPQPAEDIRYSRKGGIFVSRCMCALFVFLAALLATLVGVAVYFLSPHNLSLETEEFWDDNRPFYNQNAESAKDLRLSSHIVPSFYRLKLRANLDNSSFTGEVFIKLKADIAVDKIVLHSKDLTINSVKLTEQTYERVETLKLKRHIRSDDNSTLINELTTSVTNEPTVVEENGTVPNVQLTTEDGLSTDEPNDSSIPTQVTHSNSKTIDITSFVLEKVGDRLILTLGSSLQPNVDYVLQLSFNGKITDALTGFYKSSYLSEDKKVKVMGVTQFEPISARAAFPCFDEPIFKSQFEISIAHHKNLTVLSNMKVSTQEDIIDDPEWKWTHFEKSVSMSTYLVAYVLCDFRSLETNYTSKDNVTKTIKVWARPQLISNARYALSITPKLLNYYEEVFGVPYALDKLDLIAVPEFSSGAMENWGLITFRETTLLVDETENVPRDKQNVAIDIAHELAHQWFGNLVTMQWWTDLWLNEGFATYIEYIGVNYVEPNWNTFDMFTKDKMELLRTDALKNTSPVSREVVDASEISQKFDEISYAKGASLIRMLNHTITEEKFHNGLVLYLNKWKYSNAKASDLWVSMSEATKTVPGSEGVSLVDFMHTWTHQAGYPVVFVKRNYQNGNVTFSQKLFTTAEEPYQQTLSQMWHIPISYIAVTAPSDTWSTSPKLWLTGNNTVANLPLSPEQALYVNVDAIGYYRVNYDNKNWQLLKTALNNRQIKSPLTRAQLIDDAFNLAKVSQLNYSYALSLPTYLIDGGEDSKIVWELLLNNLGFLKFNLKAMPYYGEFQDYVQKLLAKQLEKLNYGLSKPKDDNEAFLIENLVMWECLVEAPRCLNWAKGEFSKWQQKENYTDNPIPSYLRPLVYNIALKHGGRQEFQYLWNIFQNTTDPTIKSVIITTLSSTREESLIAFLLEKSLTDIPNQYAAAVWSMDSQLGSRIAQDFLKNNWDAVHRKFTKMDPFMFPAVLNGAFGYITTEEDLKKLKSFAKQHKEELLPMSQSLQKLIDTANLRINWINKHSTTIEKWLKNFNSGNITTTTQIPTTSSTNSNVIEVSSEIVTINGTSESPSTNSSSVV